MLAGSALEVHFQVFDVHNIPSPSPAFWALELVVRRVLLCQFLFDLGEQSWLLQCLGVPNNVLENVVPCVLAVRFRDGFLEQFCL